MLIISILNYGCPSYKIITIKSKANNNFGWSVCCVVFCKKCRFFTILITISNFLSTVSGESFTPISQFNYDNVGISATNSRII